MDITRSNMYLRICNMMADEEQVQKRRRLGLSPAKDDSKKPRFPGNWGDLIADVVLKQWRSLKKHGKPQEHEMTCIAGIVACWDEDPDKIAPVALASGTKCLPASKRDNAGTLLNDSHAEALCRRAFIHFLIREMASALRDHIPQAQTHPSANPAIPGHVPSKSLPGSVLEAQMETGTFHVADSVTLHMYVSQPPCGDACVFQAGDGGDENPSDILEADRRAEGAPLDLTTGPAPRTGAKVVETSSLAPVASDVETGAQAVGVLVRASFVIVWARMLPRLVLEPKQLPHELTLTQLQRASSHAPRRPCAQRRKPGKGDATLSMSCSDKVRLFE